ncbi:uncharacterized protein LOC143275928 [Babylonia areolata]|uniref:uncharacterized protein LOC143275928 n=1 Tax=Babylonia areolata TaxID=304850 RepID=UPI003FCF89B6
MRGLPALVTVLALLAPARGGPISSSRDDDGSQCAKKCVASNKFQYARDTTYEFDYLAETATSMEDASEDTARLSVAATALVHVIGDCDMVLQLRDVTVKESDPSSQSMRNAPESARAAALLERQPLRFSFQDGVVDELCPSEEEELWALNVKRGVLSAFQNGMTRLDSDQTVTEVDVAGTCPSQYQVTNKGWYSTTVTRSKDLLACTGRHDYQTALQASPYHVQSSVQSLPLMKSTHQCEQTVDQYGILSSATCTESHQFRPFSREASGAVTKVSQSLKYKSQSRSSARIQPVSQRVSLMFQHANKEEITRKAQQEAEEVLRQLCRDTQTDIRPDTPRLFSSLVSAMRRVDTSGLKALYAKLEQNTLCVNNIRTRKFFVDALPMVGTEATVTMMTQMLMSDDVTGLEADMWLTSLALIQEPSAAMLEQVKSLLKSQTLGEKALLPVSTMINNFCQHQPQCTLESSVQSIMTSFEDLVGSSCYVNKKNLDQVLMGLRAIGNAGHVSSSVSVVNKCVKRTRNPMEVRVAAAQAFRRMPCDADRTAVTFLMEDTQEDSELRIAAYLAVMTCPDDDTLQRVQLLLESETDEQVGSFVWSHLTNLQETSSPHKQAIRQLLKNVQLPAKFNLGRLQFSHNYEGSAFLKRLNSGAAAEGNLVWSSSSSLPRSASANLTVDLFGRSLNLLDVGLRLEGLEYLLETLLGPYGYFAQEGQDKKSNKQLDELKGSLYLRMFGNEMSFQRFQGLDSFTSSSSFNMLDFLIKLSKNHDISMTHSTEFLDTEMTVPTSCGLPLSLTVKGTATVDLKASGKVDLRKVSSTPRSLQIDGEIRPSGAIQISGQMSVDAQVSRAALHVTGTLHSSTALKARVDLDRGRVLSMELDAPEDKMEIFDISSEFSIVHNTVEKKQKMITENRKTVKVCTGELASRITGLELCGELQYPNASTRVSGPYYPFTGPTSLSVALYKRDTHTSYKLLAKRVENKKKTMAQLSFNTPGSKVDRSLAFDLVLNHEDKQLEVSAASPWKKAEFKGAITNTKKLMGVSGSFITDDVNVYSLRTEVKIDESKNGVTYTPMVELRHPNRDNVALTGMVSMETKSAVVDLTLSGVTAQPLTLKSALTNTKKEVSLTGSVAKGDKQQYSLRVGSQMSISKSKMQVTPFLSVKSPKRELVSFSGSALYTQDKILKTDFIFNLINFKPVSAQFTATKSERKAAVRYVSKVNIKSAVVSSSMSATVNVKNGRLANGRVTVVYNVPRVVKDKIVIMAKLSDRSTKAYNKYTLRSSMDSKSFPDYNTAIKLNLDHKKKLSSGELEVKYGRNLKDKTKRVSVSATLARKIKNLKNMDLNFKMSAEAPQQNIDVKIRGMHEHNPSSLESNVILTYAKGKDLSAALTLKDKSNKLTKMNGELTLRASGSGFTVKSGLTQASKKQWEHSLNIKTGGSMHSINTVYKNRGGSSHEVTSTVGVDGIKPVVLSGEANLERDDLQLAGSVKQGKNTYGVSGTQKLAKSKNGKWSLEVTVPSRRVLLKANAGKVKGNYEGSLETAWDADNDKNAKVVIEGMAGSKSSKDYSSHKARVSLSSPLQGYSNLAVSLGLDSSSSQHQLSTKLVMGDKKNVITTNLVVAQPFTPRDIDVNFKAETPFRGYGSMGLTFTHKLDTGLRTKLALSLQKDQCEISLTAKNRGTDGSRDLQAQLDVKSSLRKISLKSLSVSAMHKDDGRQFSNQVDMKVNKQAYSYLMNMNVDTGSNTGDIAITWPKEQLKTTWSHRHTSSGLTSTLTTTWGASKRVQIDVTGARAVGSLSGSVALQTPWRNARDWRAEMNTQYGTGRIVSSSSVKNENREAFAHNVILTADASKTDMDFSMTSPWTQPISSKVNAKYESFPMSANAEFSWEPRKKVTAEGSVTINNWDDLDITMRVTTPVRSMRSLAAQVSSKVEGSEVVSQLNIDLGMRKNVILSTHVQRDASAMRVKLTTPWDELRVVDTGVEMSVQSAAGKVKADFKAVPFTGQYEASATWNAEDDLNARLRLDTPRDDFPYLQVVASSKAKRRVRQSRVELEYSPGQTYSLDSTYSFDTPLVLDVNVATPLSGYESLSASFRHNMRDAAMDASAQVMYTNDKAIKATAMMDWSRGLDSSVTVTTPFSGWEKSSAILRHEGEWNDFNSLADVSVAGQGLTSSLKFFNKMKTDGQLSISTPWAGWEKIEAAVSRKGDLTNLRGTATLVYSGQKMEANVVNKWNSRKARLVASLSTPYTQDMKLNFEQSADLQTEASLSYGREYSVDTSSSAVFNSREVSASTNIKYRVGGPRHLVTASFAKVGSLQDLALTATTSLNKQEISLTAELNTVRDIKAVVALRTPFNQFESLGAAFQHAGDLNQMTTEADVQYMTNKHITGKMELAIQSLDQISVRGTFTSPLSGLERSVVSLSHTASPKMCTGSFNLETTIADFGSLDASYQRTGHVNNMKAESHVTYNSQSLMDVTLAHRLSSDRLRSSLHVLTSVLPELNIDVNHRGDIRRFTTKASASAGENKVSSYTQWSMSEDNMDLSQTLSSNLQGEANKAAIILSRVGPLSDVTLQLSGNVNANKAKIVGQLATVRDLSASLEVESPFDGYRQLGASFKQTGDSNDLSVIAAANLERKKIEVVSKYNHDNEVSGSIEITTPFRGYKQMGAAFNYGGETAMISGNLQKDRIEATGRFVNAGTIEGNIDVATPFDGFKRMGAAFNFGGEQAMVSGNLENDKIEATGRFVNDDVSEGNVQIVTPFDGYKHMGAAFNYNGKTAMISGNLQNDKIEANGQIVNADSIKGNIDITTPFKGYKQMGAAFSYGGEKAMVSGNLQNDKIEATGRFVNAGTVEGEVDITTPFEGYKQMGAAFRYDGEKATVSGSLQNDKIEATSRFVNNDNIEGDVDITTPFEGYKQMGAAFKYDGKMAMISGNLQHDKIEATGRFVNADITEGNVDITTPLDGYRQMGAAFRYDGKMAKISGNLENDKIEATSRFVNAEIIEGNIDITTPFDGFKQMGAAFRYDGKTVKISGNLQNDKIEATGRFVNAETTEGNVDITTPFDGFKQMGAAFSYGGEKAMISGNLQNDKIEATGQFVNNDKIDGNVDITTPFEGYKQMGAAFRYDGKTATISGNLQNNKIEATGRFVYNGIIESNVEIMTPFDGYKQMGASFNYGGNSFTATANVQNEKVEAIAKYDNAGDITGSVEVTTPFAGYTQLGGQFRYAGDMSDITMVTSGNVENSKMEITAKFNKGQDVSGSVEMITPFSAYRTMGSSFALTGDMETIQQGGDLSLLLAANLMQDKVEARAAISNREGLSGSVTMATPFEGFTQVGATFKHTGSADNFNTEGQVTYMDGQAISGKVSLYNYRLRRIETSAELRTPFTNWEMTRLSYKHAGNSNKFECNAKLVCGRGYQHSADLKVNLRRDQNVQLTVKTPYEGFRMTELIHSLSLSDSSVQWSGAMTYGEAQRATSQLTVSYPDDRFSSRFDLQTPFTSDLTATFDLQGGLTSFTKKQTYKYGEQFQFSDELEFQINDSPLLLVSEVVTYSYGDVNKHHSLFLRRQGPWNDVSLEAKGETAGQTAAVSASFKNEFGRVEGNVNVNTPFDGFRDVGASFQHIGELSSTFNTEAKVEYTDGQEVAGKLDFTRATWQRLEVTAELTTPFEDWTQTRAEYRHTADNDGFACYAGAEYLGDQRLTGDLRVTSSPNPEVTLTMKTPWSNWEQMSATGTYQNDGWGKKEVSSKMDLGQGHVYTLQSSLSGSNSITARLTTPHADWHTLEARASHEGSVEDFKSSAYLSTPLLDAVSASASLSYRSPFDLTAAGSLDTPFEGVKDWKMEMVNGERGSQKTSHVILGWSGDQEIVMDGTWRHDNSWNERHLHTDVSLSTPFQAARRTNWVLEHHATQGKYEHKMTGSLNGDKLVDLDLSTLTADLPQVTVTLTEPYSMQYSLARTDEGAELSLDWDRNDPNSNLRVTSRFTDSTDSNGLQHDLDLKVIHPSRTVGAKYNLQVSPQNAASQGELYWGRGSNRRVFYTLDFSDLSRRSSTSYEGKVKVGVFSRAVQMSGSVSQSPVSRAMDATLHWDADRDQNKQVSLKTRWTSGEKNKADLTLSLPAINQEVHVKSEVAVNQGKTLLDATTALSYSQDSSKVLTFTSKLQDTTGAWDNGSNYTLHLTLTHPHTDLDVSMTSHLGATEDRYSAAVDTWYLTSRRQRKNMALRGEIDQLRRQLTMEMASPVKKMMMQGQVKSVEPYSLSLTNSYDDDRTIQTDVTLDTNKRSFSLKTNYDLEHPERSLVLKAFYVNDTAIKAEVYRDHVTDVITDALLALRLNTSTLLHSRLHWRSASLSELQEYSVAKLNNYASRSKQTVKSVSDAVREELAARYSRSAAALAEDLTPLVDLLHSEMNEVASQLQTLRRQLNRFYRRHPFLQNMGSAVSDRYLALQQFIGEMSDSYQQKADAISQQMKEAVQTMTQYPVGQYYHQSVNSLLQEFEELIDSGVTHLTETVVSLDWYLLAARENSIHISDAVSGAVHNLTQHPYIQSLDVTPYIEAASNKLSALRVPERYTAAIYNASARVNEVMSDVMNMESMKRFKGMSNEVYQQGVWAYNYWQVEDNLKKHLHSIATLLKEIVEEELHVYTHHFRFLQKSHVTVWDPEHGEIQAETYLPLAMETLDSLPDMTPLVTQYNEVMSSVPDMDTVQYFYDHYVPKTTWWADNNSTQQGPLLAELNEYTPSPTTDRTLRKRKFRGNRRVAAI